MALNIKSPEVERLVDELAAHTGESKTEAVRRALSERLERTQRDAFHRARVADVMAWLRTDVWSRLPPEARGKPVTKAERDALYEGD